ncbi:hypothetical protein COUCH_26715 [Couchioplanes caeruleus]|uniref:hypothetical protein n=1 Tax=Couchioplanes caeruleus TaxID=56438 RepID=UPI0020C18934|nr:hypothetical protein [Couchioplanes caeruleus]UQU62608.1 hypothetical protein COUCH_26715 [Couchioplanes caeruleus]
MSGIRRWSAALVATLAVVPGAACTSPQKQDKPPRAPGPELDADQGGAYGWHKAMAVGTRFTDGLNHLELSGAATSPLTIVSITPLMDDGPALRVLGTRIRVIPDMLPADSEVGWFEYLDGFSPKEKFAAGSVIPEGFQVRGTNGDDDMSVEVQIGYEVVAPGVSNRTGVEVVYEYEGVRKRAVIPSHLTICAPATAACQARE